MLGKGSGGFINEGVDGLEVGMNVSKMRCFVDDVESNTFPQATTEVLWSTFVPNLI